MRGSVRALGNYNERAGVAIRVLAALATRAGGEAVPAGDW
jgi:hypothetical protein